jgi:ERCC4-related helicase
MKILSRLHSGDLRVVVTTEMAARGLDIPKLTHVINLDLPTDSSVMKIERVIKTRHTQSNNIRSYAFDSLFLFFFFPFFSLC